MDMGVAYWEWHLFTVLFDLLDIDHTSEPLLIQAQRRKSQ